MEKNKSNRRIIEGIVVSNKMNGTVRVQVEYLSSHPRYKKIIKKRKIFFAHTEKELNEGDKVNIKESRPYSKNVRWVVID